MSMQTVPSTRLLADAADGAAIDQVLLVHDVERRTKRDGTPFLRLTLADRSGRVPAVAWEAPNVERASVGEPAHVVGRLSDHPRYGRQVTITDLRAAAKGETRWEDLLDGPERTAAELEHDLDVLIGSIREPHLHDLLRRLLSGTTSTGRRFREIPAAKHHHHAYPHGLLDHSVAVAQLVSAAAATLAGIDRDVAVAGALLHDLGKLEAYEVHGGCAELGDAGKLLGEIPLGFYRVRREIETIAGFPAEQEQALLHVILAHHGRLEWGSPVAPCTREATLVHAMDNLSGQMGAHDRLRKETGPGASWSRFDRALASAAFLGPA